MLKISIISTSKDDQQYISYITKELENTKMQFDMQVISMMQSNNQYTIPNDIYDYREKYINSNIILIMDLKTTFTAGMISSLVKKNKIVISMPLETEIMGFDSIVSCIQMPKGSNLITFGISNINHAIRFIARLRMISIQKNNNIDDISNFNHEYILYG